MTYNSVRCDVTKLGCNVVNKFQSDRSRFAIPSRARLEHALVAETEKAVVADHDVIENPHAHDLADFF